jgi:hypothetical protein
MYHFIYLLLDIHFFRCILSVYIGNIYIQKELRVSLETQFSQGIFIFPREISSFSFGKIEIPWENSVPKLVLKGPLFFAPKISRPPLLPIDPFHDQFYRKINT